MIVAEVGLAMTISKKMRLWRTPKAQLLLQKVFQGLLTVLAVLAPKMKMKFAPLQFNLKVTNH